MVRNYINKDLRTAKLVKAGKVSMYKSVCKTLLSERRRLVLRRLAIENELNRVLARIKQIDVLVEANIKALKKKGDDTTIEEL